MWQVENRKNSHVPKTLFSWEKWVSPYQTDQCIYELT